MLLVQNLLHRQKLDNSTRLLVEGRAFVFSVFGVTEADEETALAAAFAFSLHDGFECATRHGKPVAAERAAVLDERVPFSWQHLRLYSFQRLHYPTASSPHG